MTDQSERDYVGTTQHYDQLTVSRKVREGKRKLGERWGREGLHGVRKVRVREREGVIT